MVAKLAEIYEAGQTYFVAWGTEDYKVLNTGCERHKIENPVQYEDYLDLAEAYKLWKGDELTTGLKRATEEQEVDTGSLWHTAYDDAANTGKLLVRMLEKAGRPNFILNRKLRMMRKRRAQGCTAGKFNNKKQQAHPLLTGALKVSLQDYIFLLNYLGKCAAITVGG